MKVERKEKGKDIFIIIALYFSKLCSGTFVKFWQKKGEMFIEKTEFPWLKV